MKKIPLLLLLIASACLALVAFAGAGALAATGGPAATTVTADTWAEGVLGEVRSPDTDRCANGRRVVVYRLGGDAPNPASDDRVGSARAVTSGAGDFAWTVQIGDAGRYYAAVQKKKGCGADTSPVVSFGALGAAADGPEYPRCGPYVSEGAGNICRIENLRFHAYAVVVQGEQVCYWEDRYPNGNCITGTETGPFPWAGEEMGGRTVWSPLGAGRNLSFSVYQRDRQGVLATITGTVPSLDSPRYTVTDAIAPGEGPADQWDHFYTPNLPGQAPGEVGGPLELKKVQVQQFHGTDFTLNGYLYLKH